MSASQPQKLATHVTRLLAADPFTHSDPFQCVRVSFELTSKFPLRWEARFVTRTRSALSMLRAAAIRALCFSISSSAFGLAAGNEVRKIRALVPARINWPRLLSTAVPLGTTPPTAHTVPLLTRLVGLSPWFWSRRPSTLPTTWRATSQNNSTQGIATSLTNLGS